MLHLFICVFILEKYTWLKSLALVILHHNHSLLTRYDFLPFMYCLVVPKNLGFPKNQKNQKNKKTIFQRFLHLGLLQKRVLKYCFLFFLFFVFWKPQVFWNHQIPKPLENCISEYSKHLVLSEMSLSVAKVTEKHLQIIVSIWCKISRKNICKSMENRTPRDTRSVFQYLY